MSSRIIIVLASIFFFFIIFFAVDQIQFKPFHDTAIKEPVKKEEPQDKKDKRQNENVIIKSGRDVGKVSPQKEINVYNRLQDLLNEPTEDSAQNDDLKTKIDAKLEEARQLMEKGVLIKPFGENAFEMYEEVIENESEYGRERAVAGLEKIFQTGRSYLEEGKPKKAMEIFSALKESHEQSIREKARKKFETIEDYYIARAQRIINQEECFKAKKLLEQALSVLPGNINIKRKIDSIKNRIGELSIYSDPWARIIINGRDIHRTSPANQIKLICGTYQISLINPDDAAYKERKAKVKIRFGKRTRLIASRNKIISKLEE